MPALAAGARLGPYEIEASVGAGGMGEVYRARDTRLDRVVAVKVLPTAKKGSPMLRERFEREARLVAGLSHPHICALYDVGEEDGTAYLVMEYLDGETLADRLLRRAGGSASGTARPPSASGLRSGLRAGLPLEQALRWAVDIADALDRAHRAGIVHRDLKPANVVITKAGVKVVDFGLARNEPTQESQAAALDTDQRSALKTRAELTQEATLLGTLPYMAPEQVEGRVADARADIFAFGSLLYEMLTGRRAFAAQSEAALIASILEHQPAPLHELRPEVPEALERVVRVCLAKDPDERWQSAGDLARELAWILEQTTHPSAVRAAAQRRRWAWLPALAVGAAAAVAIVGLLSRRAGAPAGQPAGALPAVKTTIAVKGMSEPANFALSPDGRKLVLALGDPSLSGGALALRPLDTLNLREYQGTARADKPFWSPDSRTVVFASGQDLRRLDTESGDVRSITRFEGTFRGGSWGPDDAILFSTDVTGVWKVPAAGGNPMLVLPARPGQSYGRPESLPGGRMLVAVAAERPRDRHLLVVEVGTHAARKLLDAEAASLVGDRLLFARSGTLYAQPFDVVSATLRGEPVVVAEGVAKRDRTTPAAFSWSSSGLLAYRPIARDREQLTWYDRRGYRQRSWGGIGRCHNFDLSDDDARVVVVREDAATGERGLWLIEEDGARETLLLRAGEGESFDDPTFVPGGKQVAFTFDVSASPQGESHQILRRAIEGGAVEAIAKPDPPARLALMESFSRDGGLVAYLSFAWNRGRITQRGTIARLDGSGQRWSFGQPERTVDEVQFSPDARYVAYHDNSSGRNEVYLTTVPPSDRRWQVSTAGGVQPRFRGDGRELFYLAPDGTVTAVDLRFLPTSVEAGAPRALFKLPPDPHGGYDVFEVSADGQRFLVRERLSSAADEPLVLVANWRSLLPDALSPAGRTP